METTAQLYNLSGNENQPVPRTQAIASALEDRVEQETQTDSAMAANTSNSGVFSLFRIRIEVPVILAPKSSILPLPPTLRNTLYLLLVVYLVVR